MRVPSLATAFAAALLLAACASTQYAGLNVGDRAATQVACEKEKECVVEVQIDRSCSFFRNCVRTAVDFVVISRDSPTVTWRLAAADKEDFSFSGKDGIVLRTNGSHFDCGPAPDEKSFSCTLKARPERTTVVKYVINAKVARGWHAAVEPLDPWVIYN